MINERDLDHRLDGWRTGLEGMQNGMSIGFNERNKAMKSMMDDLKRTWETFKGIFGVTA